MKLQKSRNSITKWKIEPARYMNILSLQEYLLFYYEDGFFLYPLSPSLHCNKTSSELIHEGGAVRLAALALGVAVVLEADWNLAPDPQPLLQLATDLHHL